MKTNFIWNEWKKSSFGVKCFSKTEIYGTTKVFLDKDSKLEAVSNCYDLPSKVSKFQR